MGHSDYLETLVVDRDGSRLVVVTGDLDLGSVDELETVCRAPPEPEKILLDLSGVEFIDVIGLRKLLELRSGDEEAMTLVSPSHIVRRMILLAGVSDAFVFEEAREPCDV